jgi:signal peptidase I
VLFVAVAAATAAACVTGCGGSSSSAELIKHAFSRYMAAIASGDPRGACAELSSSYQAKLRTAAQGAGINSGSCTAILAAEFTSLDSATRARQRTLAATATVSAVTINGHTADLTVSTPLDGLTQTSHATAVLESGHWKVAEIAEQTTVGRDLAYRVPSGSMLPTLKIGTVVLVDPSAYRTRAPRIGDIVVLHPPAGADAPSAACGNPGQGGGHPQACDQPTATESTETFIKRIVAGPGDRISIVRGQVIRNGATETEPALAACGSDALCNFPSPIVIPEGEYFVLGDNRGGSDDSRFWGPVKRSWIIGPIVRQLS